MFGFCLHRMSRQTYAAVEEVRSFPFFIHLASASFFLFYFLDFVMMGLGSSEPWFEMDLPDPIVVDALYLVGFYVVILAGDYLLLRHEAKLPLSSVQLRAALAIFHSLLPMMVVSPWAPYNLFFAAMPWFYVSYTAILPVDRLSCREWLYSFYAVVLDIPDDERRRIAFAHNTQIGSGGHDPVAARKGGVVKLLRGAFKFWLMKHVIDQIIPEDYTVLLRLPWFSAGSLMLTVVLGIKAYLMLGVVDLGMGLEQLVLGVPLIDLQDSPIISASPRDFWRYFLLIGVNQQELSAMVLFNLAGGGTRSYAICSTS